MMINLDPESEPDICNAITRDALLGNVTCVNERHATLLRQERHRENTA